MTTPGWTRSTRARAVIAACALAFAAVVVPSVAAHADTTTNSNDALLTGWYPDQPALSPSFVTGGTFGQQASMLVDGQVYAQPLVSNGVLLVATENNFVYGFNKITGTLLWSRSLGTPFVPNSYFSASNQCGDITPNVGVTSTPVVDGATGTMYLTSKALTTPGVQTSVKYVMHAISVTTGLERIDLGFPVTMQGNADNDPTHVFTPATQLQRPGLLLMNGVVYAAFGGHCDNGPYEGWVMGVSAATGTIKARWTDEAGVPQTGGNGPAGAGIWHAGGGLMNDKAGSFVVASGNGHIPTAPTAGITPPGSLAQSVIRVTAQTDGTLRTTDFFSPVNGASLNANDSDIGSGPAVGLPGADVLNGSPFGTSTYPHVMLQVGKAGYIYLMDADNMGGLGQGTNGSDATVNTVQGFGVWGKPSVWPGDGGWVYMTTAQGGGGSGTLRAYKYGLDGAGKPTLAYRGRAGIDFGYGSSAPIITSDGTSSGSALVWTIWSPNASGVGGQLQAYQPVPVNGTLTQVFSAPIGTANKFTTPTADSGRVYVAARDGHVLIFGSPIDAALSGGSVILPNTVIGQSSTGTVSLTANKALTVSSVTSSSPQFVLGTPSSSLPATLAQGDALTVPVTFTPGSKGLSAATFTALTTDGATAKVGLSGTGQSPGPDLSVYPCCLNFGGVQAGGTSSNTFTLTNAGAATLHITGENLPTNPYSVSGLPGVGATIAPGGSVTATVSFSPDGIGEYTNELGVATDGGNTTISLDGTGGTAPQMDITATSLQYGDVPLGVTATQNFTVRNVGGTPLTITKSKPPQGAGGFAADTASIATLAEGVVIQPGASLTARVNFTPTANGASTSDWVLNANDTTGVRTVTLTGRGTAAPKPTVIVGNVDVTVPTSGTTPANFPVYLSPQAVSPISTSFITHDGSAKASAGNYVATSKTGVPATVAPGQTTTVPITVNSYAATSTLKFYLDPVVSAAAYFGVNGLAWLNVTASPHTFVVPAPMSAWRSPSEDTRVNVPIFLEGPAASDTQFTVQTVNGTAVAGTDYTAVAPTVVTIPAGQSTYLLPVTVKKGGLGATTSPPTFTVSLTNARGVAKLVASTATVTIYQPSSDVSTPPAPDPLTWSQVTPATTGTVGSRYAYSFSANGFPAPTFSLAPGSVLPPGIDLDSTGILAGTPTAAGDYSFAVVASNGVSTSITSPTISLHIDALPVAPSWLSASPPGFADVGLPYTYKFVATGQPAPSYSVSSGGLPPGLSINASTGSLSGTPTTLGNYTFTLSASNGIDIPADTPPITIVVGQGMSFTSATSATGYLGQPFTFTVVATGSPVPTLSISAGTLPTGLTFTPYTDGTASVAGTISPTTATGPVALTFKAINGTDTPVTQPFTLTVAPVADLQTTFTGPGTVTLGTQITYTVTVTNNGPSPLTSPASAVFTLPAGTSFVSALSGGTFVSGKVSWTLSGLGAGAHVNLKVTLGTTSTGTKVASATSSSSVYDPTPANNTATWTSTVR